MYKSLEEYIVGQHTLRYILLNMSKLKKKKNTQNTVFLCLILLRPFFILKKVIYYFTPWSVPERKVSSLL